MKIGGFWVTVAVIDVAMIAAIAWWFSGASYGYIEFRGHTGRLSTLAITIVLGLSLALGITGLAAIGGIALRQTF